MPDYESLSVSVRKLNALLNDRHPDLKSWRWLVEHTCVDIVNQMIELDLLDENVEDE